MVLYLSYGSYLKKIVADMWTHIAPLRWCWYLSAFVVLLLLSYM